MCFFLVREGKDQGDWKTIILRIFDEAIFLSDLAKQTGQDMVELWKVILELEQEGKVYYFSWQGKTVVVKRR